MDRIKIRPETILKNRHYLLTHFDYDRQTFVCNSQLYAGETIGDTQLAAQVAFLEMVVNRKHEGPGRPGDGRGRYAVKLSDDAVKMLNRWMTEDGSTRQQILEKIIFERAGWMYPAPEGRQ